MPSKYKGWSDEEWSGVLGKGLRGIDMLQMQQLHENTGMLSLLEEMNEAAEEMVQSPDPELPYELFRLFRETGDRLSYERPYFLRRKRLNSFAIGLLMHPHREDYLRALQETLWAICSEPTWCLPAHYQANESVPPIDLFAAETAFTLSELGALLEDHIDDQLLSVMKSKVERRVLRPFYEHTYDWERADHNWAAVCAGSIGAAALYQWRDTPELVPVIKRVVAAMNCYLSGIGEDGACMEGYGYWQYGFGYYVYFAQLLLEATDQKVNLFTQEKVRKSALFQQKIFTGGRTTVNFSDTPPTAGVFMGLSHYLHKHFSDMALPPASVRAGYLEDHCGRWAPAIRNLIWNDSMGGSDWEADSYYLHDAKWLISRLSVGEDNSANSYCFAARGGHNAEPHNHNDLGHFLLHANGESYLSDLGSGMYTADYFGAKRYEYWCNGSQGHSVPIILGKHQSVGAAYKSWVLQVETSPQAVELEIDLKDAYEASACIGFTRRLQWGRDLPNESVSAPALLLEDRFVLSPTAFSEKLPDGQAMLIERFITPLLPMQEAEGIITLKGNKRLTISYDPLAWRPVVEQRTDIDHFGAERSWYTLDFEWIPSEAVKGGCEISARFVFQFDDEWDRGMEGK